MDEYFGTGSKKGRGRAQKSIDLIEAMYVDLGDVRKTSGHPGRIRPTPSEPHRPHKRASRPQMTSLDRSEWAKRLDTDLRELLPYWLRTAVDKGSGGYQVVDEIRTVLNTLGELKRRVARAIQPSSYPLPKPEWHIVPQSRLLYVFSLAHRLGYSDGRYNYLDAAAHGYEFIKTRLVDRRHGGCYWR